MRTPGQERSGLLNGFTPVARPIARVVIGPAGTKPRRGTGVGGFTLVEMAVVLIVIALITGMGMVSTLGVLESARRAQTQNKLDVIEEALMAFREQYNRLPCPGDITLTDSSSVYGLEAANSGACTGGSPAASDVSGNAGGSYLEGWPPAVSGGVPARSLNLPDEYMFDGWGRRFTYVVDAHGTAPNAFSIIPPDANNCSLWVLDNAGGYRSGSDTKGGAMYVLISHGSNGHGAYINGASRISVGSTNTAEQVNCRCDSAGQSASATDLPFYLQMEISADPNDPYNNFDDIVRFKERWQLMNEDDYQRASKYPEYQLIVGLPYIIGEAPKVGFYKRGCDGWVHSRNQSDLIGAPGDPGDPTNVVKVMGLAITDDNGSLLTYVYQTSLTEFCNVYDLSVVTPSVVSMACGDYNTDNRMAMSNNDYAVIGTTTGAQIYKEANGSFNLLASLGVSQPKVVALGKNADYLMLTNKSSYASVYGRTDSATFAAFASTSQPITSNYSKLRAIAFSPDNTILAIGTTDDEVRLWSIGTGNPYIVGGASPFNDGAITDITGLGSDVIALAFSPDGQYLAVGLNNAAGTTPSAHVKIYKIDGTTFSAASISATGDYYIVDDGDPTNEVPVDLAFTPDSNTLLVSSSECCIVALDRVSALTFQQRVPPMNPDLAFESGGPTAMAVYH